MHCATLCVTARWKRLTTKTRFWSSTRPAFLKQGKASCGVARQYTGSAAKTINCQIGVFAAYVSRHGHAFIDRALYLPKEWTDSPARLKAAHVPMTWSLRRNPGSYGA